MYVCDDSACVFRQSERESQREGKEEGRETMNLSVQDNIMYM